MMEKIQIHPRIEEALKLAKLQDPSSLLQMAPADIQRKTNLKPPDINRLKLALAGSFIKLPISTGSDLISGNIQSLAIHRLSSGCQVIDALMRGGFVSRGITEISGESGCGKTQLALQLCLTVQLPCDLGGLDSGALYICTEYIPHKRLVQMARAMASRSTDQQVKAMKFTDNVFLENAPDLETFKHCLYRKAPFLLQHKRVKLLIIDSIAAVLRSEFTSKENLNRSKQITSIGAFLHKLSAEHNIPIICVNQVTAVMDKQDSSGKSVKPALGLSWSNLVTTRIMLGLTGRSISIRDRDNKRQLQATSRTFEVIFSPNLPNVVCPYVIDEVGVRGLGSSDFSAR